MITSQPELSYTSVLSTVRCYPITSGELEGSTFVEWTGNFSSDANAGMKTHWEMTTVITWTNSRVAGVIQDAKFKRREALADLAKVAAKF